jgi:hypothetical protein
MMNRYAVRLALLTVLLAASALALAGPPATEFGPWKVVGKIKLPTPPTGLVLSEDNRQVLALCPEKRRRDSGGIGPGYIQVTVLRCFAADTGKQLFARDMSLLTARLSVKSHRLALNDTFDKVTVYDVFTWKPVALLDTRSASDRPPVKIKGIQGLEDFGGGGRLGDLELTSDGKMLVTARFQSSGWKENAKKTAWTAESFQQITFWDVDKGVKLATLDCEDKLAHNPTLSLLPRRNQMLVRYDNGVRVVDLATRKWATILPVKDVYQTAVSPDEKVVAVSGRD